MRCEWIKLKDINGEEYSYEDCEITTLGSTITIFFTAPIGVVKKCFVKKNLVSYEYLLESDRRKEEK